MFFLAPFPFPFPLVGVFLEPRPDLLVAADKKSSQVCSKGYVAGTLVGRKLQPSK